jgi:hypothetical protein
MCMPKTGIKDARLRSYYALYDTMFILEGRFKARWNGFEPSRPQKQRVESSIVALLKQGYLCMLPRWNTFHVIRL